MASSLFRYRREKCSFVSPFVASLFLFPPFPVRYVARSSTTLNDAAINNAHCECTKIYYATSIIRYRFLKTRLFSFSFFHFSLSLILRQLTPSVVKFRANCFSFFDSTIVSIEQIKLKKLFFQCSI